ncbi:Ldh family oxidoreductase [Actinobacteria bacterium YIM 96077]|uniref:Ldh family oxidoreductase n=2 Tax=Phytoactinopolyspora halophila TaxID=1981511 RepID=A0A329QG09_9ACTN|nr:Ldh family oxidoreductase [Actinobacteria bacterium YIM 96077]RAW10629.1 Ldh family oxidoreductase [Phytoactinopolyspora halophila]
MQYSPGVLAEFASRALRAVDVPPEDADVTSRSLVQADQRGIHSHGLLRLPLYVSALQAGGINPRPDLHWIDERGATALLDADAGLGQVAMNAAVRRAISITHHHGAAVVAVQNSVHYGAGAYWTDELAAHGLIGILTSTTGPSVTPYGGASKLLGTNPLTIAVPSTDDHPLTADFATSEGAYGKIVAARNDGRPIPAGWAVDAHGDPTTDAERALQGALLPFGGPKGSALSVVLEALGASLTTAAFAHETRDIWNDHAVQMNTGHLLIAIDTASFAGRTPTERRVARLQERVRDSGAPDAADVYAPGDIEYGRARAETVMLPASTAEQLDQLADSLGIPRVAGTTDAGGQDG